MIKILWKTSFILLFCEFHYSIFSLLSLFCLIFKLKFYLSKSCSSGWSGSDTGASHANNITLSWVLKSFIGTFDADDVNVITLLLLTFLALTCMSAHLIKFLFLFLKSIWISPLWLLCNLFESLLMLNGLCFESASDIIIFPFELVY